MLATKMNIFMKEVIDALINMGKDGTPLPYKVFCNLKDIGCNAYVIAENFETLSLSNDDLLCFFKGTVIFEEKYSKNIIGSTGYGSTTPVPHIYRLIEKRNLDSDLKLANWAARNSKNIYVPFGYKRGRYERLGYKDAVYEKYDKKRQENIEREQEIQIQARIKREKKKERVKRKLAQHIQTTTKQREIRKRIELLSPDEQIETIVLNRINNVYCYTPIIEKLLKRDDVGIELLKSLIKRIEKEKDSKHKKKLIKGISNRIKRVDNVF